MFLVGYVFSTASGHADFRLKVDGTRALLDAAAEATSEFLRQGNGHVIKDAATKKITHADEDELALAFRTVDVRDAWGTGRVMKELTKVAAANNSEVPDGCDMQ